MSPEFFPGEVYQFTEVFTVLKVLAEQTCLV